MLFSNGMLCFALLFAAVPAQEGDQRVASSGVTVAASPETGTFTLRDNATGVEYVSRGRPASNAARTETIRAGDAPLGETDAFAFVAGNGDTTVLATYPSHPFVFVQMRHTNTGTEPESVAYLSPVQVPLALPGALAGMKILGTAGLTACDANPGSYTFLAVADPKTRAGAVAAWLTQERGSGLVFSRVEDGALVLEPRCEYGGIPLAPGATIASEWLVLGYFADARIGLEQYASLVAAYYRIQLPPQPCGYCTWYSDQNGGASDQEHLKELGDFAAAHLKPYGFGFVQIDDHWQGAPRDERPLKTGTHTEEYLGKSPDAKERWWGGPHSDFTAYDPNGPYGEGGMRTAASNMRASGLTPGLWLMPFAWDPMCDALQDHHEWFAKQPNGSLYYAHWAGWSLDMTHPDARDFLAASVRRICRDWGYGYLKLDGLWTGTATRILYINNGYQKDDYGTSVLHDETMTPVEAYRQGLKVVREAAGQDTFLLGCNVAQNMRTLGASFGLLDAMRVGPDNGPEWWAITVGPWHGTNRYFLNGRVWYNDPDPVYVRASMPVEHARLICSWAALSGQLTVSSDWLPGLPADRLDILRRAIPSHRLTARPVDYFERDFPRIWQVTDTRNGVRRDVMGFFNWDSEAPADIELTCESLGLPADTEFACFNFWSNAFMPVFTNRLLVNVPPASCRVLAIRAMEEHPVVLGTSRHITQGGVDLDEEAWHADTNTLTGVSALVAGDPYELRIVLPDSDSVWKATGIAADSPSVSAALTHTPEGLRAILTSAEGGPVSWSITFSRTP